MRVLISILISLLISTAYAQTLIIESVDGIEEIKVSIEEEDKVPPFPITVVLGVGISKMEIPAGSKVIYIRVERRALSVCEQMNEVIYGLQLLANIRP